MADAVAPPPPFTYAAIRKANSVRSVLMAFERRPLTWRPFVVEDDGGEGSLEALFDANCVWKPLSKPLPLPPVTLRRSHAEAGRRAMANHMVGVVSHLTAKDRLHNTLTRYATASEAAVPRLAPPCFVLSGTNVDAAEDVWGWDALSAAVAANPDAVWICKPPAMNRGHGIQLCRTLGDIAALMSPAQRCLVVERRKLVVQQYIPNPLLIAGRKFDLRVWVLFTDSGSVYVFPKPYVRTSSVKFTMDGDFELAAHLTNYSVQKTGDALGAFEDGNTLMLDEAEAAVGRGPWAAACMDKVVDAVRHTALAVSHRVLYPTETDLPEEVAARATQPARPVRVPIMERIRKAQAGKAGGGAGGEDPPPPKDVSPLSKLRQALQTSRRHQFELLGYDFLVTDELECLLIEVNANPTLNFQTPAHKDLVVAMMDSLFATVVDPVFPPVDELPPVPADHQWVKVVDLLDALPPPPPTTT